MKSFYIQAVNELSSSKAFSMSYDEEVSFKLKDTPFKVFVYKDIRHYSELIWYIDINSHLTKSWFSGQSLNITPRHKTPVKVKRSDSTKRKSPEDFLPKYMPLASGEIRDLLLDAMPKYPDYLREYIILNMHIFFPIKPDESTEEKK